MIFRTGVEGGERVSKMIEIDRNIFLGWVQGGEMGIENNRNISMLL